MYTCISSHGLKRSWRSCPRRVNAGNKNTPSTHHPRRRNVTTLMVGLKNGHVRKNLTQKVVNPRDIAGEREKKRKKKRRSCEMSGYVMMIMIKLKGAVQDCCNLLTVPRTVFNTYAKVARPVLFKSRATPNHMQYIKCFSSSTRMPWLFFTVQQPLKLNVSELGMPIAWYWGGKMKQTLFILPGVDRDVLEDRTETWPGDGEVHGDCPESAPSFCCPAEWHCE